MNAADSLRAYFEDGIRRNTWLFPPDLPPDGDDFRSRARRALLEGLRRLDALPRDDPFRKDTNLRPTFFKLHDFNRRLRERDPCDEQALWCEIALDQIHGSGYLSVEEWRQLHRCGGLNVRWPIHSAWAIVAELGENASHGAFLSRDLARFLRDEGLCEAARPVLLALPSEAPPPPPELVPPPSPEEWAGRVLRGMADPRLWDGVSAIDAVRDGFPEVAGPLLKWADLAGDALAGAGAQTGYASVHPDRTWNEEVEAPFAAYLEREIRPVADTAQEDERPVALLSGSLGYGALLGLRERGSLDEAGFRIADEYLTGLLVTEPLYLTADLRA